MNKATENFVKKLDTDENVLGVILFGSWARGNNRPNSDVDLIIIQKEGMQRCVETHDDQVFEIVYTTPNEALKFWQENKDGCYGLWSVAKIILDKDGAVEKLREKGQEVINQGKPSINEKQRGQLLFDKEDKLRYIKETLDSDKTTAALVLNQMVFEMTGLYFDLRQQWSPAPKQCLVEIGNKSPGLAELLKTFYFTNETPMKIEAVESMLPIVFGDQV